MQKSFIAGTEAEPEVLFEVVADLATYPSWLQVVSAVEPVEAHRDDDGDRAWSVTLRARIGPLARSKRLRMCRTRHETTADGGGAVRFERRETDGRDHAAWTMEAVVRPGPTVGDGDATVGGGEDRVGGDAATAGEQDRVGADADGGPWSSVVELTLHYDGSMWSGLLDGLLDGAADAATRRLRRHVQQRV